MAFYNQGPSFLLPKKKETKNVHCYLSFYWFRSSVRKNSFCWVELRPWLVSVVWTNYQHLDILPWVLISTSVRYRVTVSQGSALIDSIHPFRHCVINSCPSSSNRPCIHQQTPVHEPKISSTKSKLCSTKISSGDSPNSSQVSVEVSKTAERQLLSWSHVVKHSSISVLERVRKGVMKDG